MNFAELYDRYISTSVKNLTDIYDQYILNHMETNPNDNSELNKNMYIAQYVMDQTIEALSLGSDNKKISNIEPKIIERDRIGYKSYINEMVKMNKTNCQISEAIIKNLRLIKRGNCEEHGVFAMCLARQLGVNKSYLCNLKGYDHAFALLNYNINGYNTSSVVCDPWAHVIFPYDDDFQIENNYKKSLVEHGFLGRIYTCLNKGISIRNYYNNWNIYEIDEPNNSDLSEKNHLSLNKIKEIDDKCKRYNFLLTKLRMSGWYCNASIFFGFCGLIGVIVPNTSKYNNKYKSYNWSQCFSMFVVFVSCIVYKFFNIQKSLVMEEYYTLWRSAYEDDYYIHDRTKSFHGYRLFFEDVYTSIFI